MNGKSGTPGGACACYPLARLPSVGHILRQCNAFHVAVTFIQITLAEREVEIAASSLVLLVVTSIIQQQGRI